MVNIYDLSKNDFDKHSESNNNEFLKLLKNVPESEYNIIMRILKRANSPTNYCSQSYADFMISTSSLDNDGYVKLFKELLNAYEISTKDVLSMNESRLIIFNKLRDAQNVYKEKFKDGKIKIEDAHADDIEENCEEGCEEECVVDKSTKSKTKKSSSKLTEPKTSKATKTPKEAEPKEAEPKEEEPKEKKKKDEIVEPKETTTKGKKKEVSVPKSAPAPEPEPESEPAPIEKGKRVKKGK
jgi:hypothetical protein